MFSASTWDQLRVELGDEHSFFGGSSGLIEPEMELALGVLAFVSPVWQQGELPGAVLNAFLQPAFVQPDA